MVTPRNDRDGKRPSSGGGGAGLTELLDRWGRGDEAARDEAMAVAYPELRAIARRHFRGQPRDHTLQATGLVHEAYQRLVRQDVPWENRRHFFAFASVMMRRILVDHARARRRRGLVTTLEDHPAAAGTVGRLDLIALDEALGRLEVEHPFEAKVVELRYFGGLSIEETAEQLDVGHATVERAWALARAWLFRALQGG